MTLDSFRSKAVKFIDPFIGVFSALHLTPNMLSVTSLFVALLAGNMLLPVAGEQYNIIHSARHGPAERVPGWRRRLNGPKAWHGV